MEDLTLEEFMKNPDKYREPEAPGRPPYRVGLRKKSTGEVKKFNAPDTFGDNLYDSFAEAHEAASKLFYHEFETPTAHPHWRQEWTAGGSYYHMSDLVIIDDKGRAVFTVATEGDEETRELGEPQPGDGP